MQPWVRLRVTRSGYIAIGRETAPLVDTLVIAHDLSAHCGKTRLLVCHVALLSTIAAQVEVGLK